MIGFLFNVLASLYAYCTDFIINLSHLTGISYYELNFFFFCFLYPALTILLLVWYIRVRRRAKRFAGI